MNKDIVSGKEVRGKSLDGIDLIVNIVKVTLESNGGSIVIDNTKSLQKLTKDGVIVARELVLQEDLKKLGLSWQKKLLQSLIL